jgi:hypothetical protein
MSLIAVIDRLTEMIAEHLGIPKCDDLSMPPDIRDVLVELRRLAAAAGNVDEGDDDAPSYDDGYQDALEDIADARNDRLDRLRDYLACEAGLASWEWRRLPHEIVELLE